ncbi:unnamed protein product [Hermetia illucens]|uniref:Eukaryotic translation initiation factor 3 subunit A n=1 Tax=Hermetia illucens TaxID=343691 RepID=A0A7R8UMQ5_HERIL|nr:eukaryotic translation initiation factor 3 subunit A [Hermetia illucens]CAD7083732.1 unnamed protein product [Hermetia illucens]
MSRYIQRPENALKRANEFIDVGKPARALDTLQDVFRNKKWTYTFSESVIEPIMFKYLYLCVELKKSHIAKEGLFQYRNMFQLVNVGSLENVIRGYLRMAEERAEAAQQQSSQAVLDVDDLDNIATPESILMSAVCGEDAQDRSDRTILLPWVKFLWESYCQCLELLRVNTHCETLYHDIARMAFQFCLKYGRKSEFRRLCDKLRKHLEDICKGTTTTTGVSITKLETQQLNLDTRLHQLDSAIQMELWQEAYKAIEDIHGLMSLSKKTPVAKTMANYYQKLAMVFWKAGNQLFHAAALLKLFQLTREMKKNITQEEMQRMASHVLIATLSIPLPSAHPEFDRFIETDKSPLEKAQKLAVLLGLNQPPTRVSLLKDVVRLNVVNLAAEQFTNLYTWLEVDFDPLNLCKRVQTVIDFISADENSLLNQYTQSLQDVTLMRLIRQVSQVYQSIEFTRLLELAQFTDAFYLERILVDCVRHNDMQITIDHKRRCIHFGTDLTESQREDHPDGPQLQSMPSEQVRSQLVNMAVVLHRAIAAIYPNRKKEEREKARLQMVENYHEIKDKEHHRILQRQKIIEDRKEFIEKLNIAREEEELRRQEELSRQHKLAEQKRIEQEIEERERKRRTNEIQAIKEKSLKEKMQQMSQTAHGKKMLSKLDEEGLKKLDAEQIAARETEELLKERKELQMKLKSQEKKIDYFERAKRMEEIPLIEKFLADKRVQDMEFWERQEATRIENAIAERKNAVAQQERLKRMHPDRDAFMEKLRAERQSLYVEKLKEFNAFLEEERKARLAKRIIERREARRQAWIKEKEEEKRRREEEIRKAQEEKERQEAERRRKEREAEEEKRRVMFEKQRQKEEETERRIQEEREQLARKEKERERDTRDTRDAWRGGQDRGEREDGWRKGPPRPTAAAAAGGESGAPESSWRTHRDTQGGGRGPAPGQGGGEKWRRTGDDRPIRRDDRPPRDDFRRGGDDRDRDGGRDRRDDRDKDRRDDRYGPPRRDGPRDGPRGENRGGDNWRARPAPRDDDRDGRDGRRPPQGGDRDRDRDRPSARGPPTKDGSWRSERQINRDDDRKERPPPRQERDNRDRDDGEWTNVKRR